MDARTTIPLTEAVPAAPHPGHAGACGCGESSTGAPELDVRAIPPAVDAAHGTARVREVEFEVVADRFGHGIDVSAVDCLDDAPHDPKPLLAQIADREGPLTVTYLVEGPDAWRLELTRA